MSDTNLSKVDHEDEVTPGLVAPLVTCTAKISETSSSSYKAPDVTCIVNKNYDGSHDIHEYQEFLGPGDML